MPFAASSETRFARVVETAFGVTPATPTFKILRATSGGLRATKSTVTSDEIRADRNISDEALVGVDVTGSYPFELSYGTYDDELESVMRGAWITNVLKNGVTPKYLTYEETLELGATDTFSRFSGCSVNSMAMAIAARAKVTGSFGIMGQKETLASVIVTGATYTAATTEPVLTASAHVAGLTIAGLAPVPVVRAINFEVNNGYRTRPSVGSLYSEEFGAGPCNVTGTLEIYFGDIALYQKVVNHDFGALSFTVGAVTAKKYTFLFPKIILLDGAKQVGGNSDDVILSVPFRAVYDATEACSLKITRAVA